MSFRESIIYDAVYLCGILPDDEIRRLLEREISSMERPLSSMVLTWEKTRTEYLLEIILTEEAAESLAVPEARHVTVGCVGGCEYNALHRLIMTGRRLFFRLKKDFPMLRRKLGTSRFVCTKMR